MAKTNRKAPKKSRPKKRRSALKPTKGGGRKVKEEKKHVRFPTPPHTNCQKSLSNYSLSELLDVYERFVHLELLGDQTVGKKMGLHKAFHLLFGYYDEWFLNFLFVSDKRRKKKVCCYYEG